MASSIADYALIGDPGYHSTGQSYRLNRLAVLASFRLRCLLSCIARNFRARPLARGTARRTRPHIPSLPGEYAEFLRRDLRQVTARPSCWTSCHHANAIHI